MNPLHLLREAGREMKRFPALIALYVAVHILLVLAFYGLDAYLAPLIPEGETPPAWVQIPMLFKQCSMVFIVAALQALLFARMGVEVDKPLWKCSDDKSALERFFMIWLILNLFVVMVESLARFPMLANSEAGQASIALLYLFVSLLYFPIGVCIMHYGALCWEELGQALRPLIKEFRLTILVLLILCTQYLFYMGSAIFIAPLETGLQQAILLGALYIPLTLLEILAFLAMWRVCMLWRDRSYGEEDSGGFPF